jgi:hypothetical protein
MSNLILSFRSSFVAVEEQKDRYLLFTYGTYIRIYEFCDTLYKLKTKTKSSDKNGYINFHKFEAFSLTYA